MTGTPRIGLVFRPGSLWLGGFYYLQNLLLALAALPQDERPATVSFVASGANVPLDELEPLVRVVAYRSPNPRRTPRTRVLDVARRLDAHRRSLPWGLTGAARRAPVDVVFPHFHRGSRGPFAELPWIPDLQHFHLPDYFSAEERAARTALYAKIAERSRTIVVSSETASRELEERFPAAHGKLRVLRFTTVPRVDWYEGEPDGVARRYGVARPYVMLPNQLWLHKNHLAVFEAVRRLRDDGVDLALVCTGGTEDYRHPEHPARIRQFVERHGLAGSIRFLGVVPRGDYVQLLRGAAVVAQPSRFEGWSSTVEDGRALGKRLVLSDLAVHREQAPAGARYVDPDDDAGFAAAIGAALDEPPPLSEKEALEAQQARVTEYARSFRAIAAEAAAA